MIKLPELPYELTDLAPNISQQTLSYHHEKHHAGYVEKLNTAITDHAFEDATLEKIIRKTDDTGIFNNAAQTWNHAFYWHSMSPNTTKPSAKLSKAIDKSFSSFDNFKERFLAAASGQFGSGWAWLLANKDGKLKIKTTPNADTPITGKLRPLLVCDVWEHAYYLDYQNDRGAYLESFWTIINWEFANANFHADKQRKFASL